MFRTSSPPEKSQNRCRLCRDRSSPLAFFYGPITAPPSGWMPCPLPGDYERALPFVKRAGENPESGRVLLRIGEKDRRNVRTPQVKRVLRRPVAALPLHSGGDVIDVRAVFGKRSPRVLHVVEIVRAEHVPPGAPAARVAARRHLRGPAPHVLDAGHVPGTVVPAFRRSLRESHQ